MGSDQEWANDSDGAGCPLFVMAAVGCLLAAIAVIAGSFGRYNRLGGSPAVKRRG